MGWRGQSGFFPDAARAASVTEPKQISSSPRSKACGNHAPFFDPAGALRRGGGLATGSGSLFVLLHVAVRNLLLRADHAGLHSRWFDAHGLVADGNRLGLPAAAAGIASGCAWLPCRTAEFRDLDSLRLRPGFSRAAHRIASGVWIFRAPGLAAPTWLDFSWLPSAGLAAARLGADWLGLVPRGCASRLLRLRAASAASLGETHRLAAVWPTRHRLIRVLRATHGASSHILVTGQFEFADHAVFGFLFDRLGGAIEERRVRQRSLGRNAARGDWPLGSDSGGRRGRRSAGGFRAPTCVRHHGRNEQVAEPSANER